MGTFDRTWRSLGTLASIAALVAGTVGCANSGENGNALAPSSSRTSIVAPDGKGGKPGSGNTTSNGTIVLDLVKDNNNDGVPSFGDVVTFTVQTTATAYPWVTVKCSQNGTVVYQQSNAMYLTASAFTLGPTPMWQGGAASCTASLENWDNYSKNGSIVELASMTFAVN
jgi:hypothetical protein